MSNPSNDDSQSNAREEETTLKAVTSYRQLRIWPVVIALVAIGGN